MTPLVLVLLAAVKTSSTAEAEEEAARRPLRALILPVISGEQVAREPKLDEGVLEAFSESLSEAALAVFAWRRFEAMASDEAREALAAALPDGKPCRSEACARAVAAELDATHVVFSRLTRVADGSCRAFVARYALVGAEGTRRIERSIAPCTADNVLGSALELGREIAEGPRAPVQVTLSLTPLQIPSIDIPEIPEIGPYATTTSTRARRMPLERALELYRKNHMFSFEEDDHPGFHVARGGKLINECDVRRAASAPIPGSMLEYCEGNNWEFAWTVVPLGLLFAGIGAQDFKHSGGTLVFAFGSGVVLTSAFIAMFFNVDAADVDTAGFLSPREQVELIIAKSNREWRERLDLTEAEVSVAGMRR